MKSYLAVVKKHWFLMSVLSPCFLDPGLNALLRIYCEIQAAKKKMISSTVKKISLALIIIVKVNLGVNFYINAFYLYKNSFSCRFSLICVKVRYIMLKPQFQNKLLTSVGIL